MDHGEKNKGEGGVKLVDRGKKLKASGSKLVDQDKNPKGKETRGPR